MSHIKFIKVKMNGHSTVNIYIYTKHKIKDNFYLTKNKENTVSIRWCCHLKGFASACELSGFVAYILNASGVLKVTLKFWPWYLEYCILNTGFSHIPTDMCILTSICATQVVSIESISECLRAVWVWRACLYLAR